MILGMTYGYFWNLVNIVVGGAAATINFVYVATHDNGRKAIRAWIAFVMTVAVAIRVMLAYGYLSEREFTGIYRPWAALIVAGFMLGPMIDWHIAKK